MELDTSLPAKSSKLVLVSLSGQSEVKSQSNAVFHVEKHHTRRVAVEDTMLVSTEPSAISLHSADPTGPRVVFFSTPHYHPTLTRFHAHPVAWLHKLPDNLTFGKGLLVERLVMALAGIVRAGIRLGDPIVIWSV